MRHLTKTSIIHLCMSLRLPCGACLLVVALGGYSRSLSVGVRSRWIALVCSLFAIWLHMYVSTPEWSSNARLYGVLVAMHKCLVEHTAILWAGARQTNSLFQFWQGSVCVRVKFQNFATWKPVYVPMPSYCIFWVTHGPKTVIYRIPPRDCICTTLGVIFGCETAIPTPAIPG